MKVKTQVHTFQKQKKYIFLQGLFKLSTAEGEEIYFLSAGPADRDGWAHAIGAIIRSLSTSTQVCNVFCIIYPS